MSRNTVVSIFSFVLFIGLQVLLFKKLVLFNTAFCFLYVAFILLLPIETNPLVLMLLAFVSGLILDTFYDHQGMHAAATVALAYVRNYWLRFITPQGGYDLGAEPTLSANGLVWFLSYSVPLVLLHHLILFYLEAATWDLFWRTLARALSSMLFTVGLLLVQQYYVSGKVRT